MANRSPPSQYQEPNTTSHGTSALVDSFHKQTDVEEIKRIMRMADYLAVDRYSTRLKLFLLHWMFHPLRTWLDT